MISPDFFINKLKMDRKIEKQKEEEEEKRMYRLKQNEKTLDEIVSSLDKILKLLEKLD